MQALPPVPEPDGLDQFEWESIVGEYVLGGPVIVTPIDYPTDIVQSGPDGMVTVFQVKWVPSRLRPAPAWTKAVKEWRDAFQDGRLGSSEKPLAGSLDESSAQNATAAASARMFSFFLVDACSAGRDIDAANRLHCYSGEPYAAEFERRNPSMDIRPVASWLNPFSASACRAATKPIGATARSRQISGESLEFGLVSLLSHWGYLAHGDLQPGNVLLQRPGRVNREPMQEALCAVAAATQASKAALEARTAILTQPWGTSKEIVAAFAADWLNFHPTPGLVEATGNALLFASLDDLEPSDESALTDELKKDVCRRHNSWRPIGETQLCGVPVDYLSRTIGPAQPGLTPRTVGDNVVDPWDLEDVALGRAGEWHDPRIGRILCQLKPEELRVAIAYGDGGTWAEAALSCGLPEEYGERVRRKLRRKGEQFVNRIGESAA